MQRTNDKTPTLMNERDETVLVNRKSQLASLVIGAAAALLVLGGTACGPTAFEAKRLADQCNATYGFNSAKSVACMNTGHEQLAMAGRSKTKGL